MERKDSLPEWYKTQEFILTSYRPQSTVYNSFWSIFQWHNETLSIHTHLLAGIYYLFLYMNDSTDTRLMSWEHFFLWIISHLGPTAMAFSSAFAHTFHIVDSRWSMVVWRIDFAGIIFVNLSHYALDALLLTKILEVDLLPYLLVHILFAGGCLWDISTGVGHHWGIHYPLISLPFTGLNLLLALRGTTPQLYTACMYSCLCSIYMIVAATFFIGKVPERFFAGFDLMGSHTFHHLFILASITAGRNGATVLHEGNL
jgi:adiponectin receptor